MVVVGVVLSVVEVGALVFVEGLVVSLLEIVSLVVVV